MQPLSMYTILIVVVGIFPAVWLSIQIYWFFTRHNVVRESLHYRWTNVSSNPNPVSTNYISGHQFLTINEIEKFNKQQKREAKKKGLKPMYIGSFRMFDKFAKDLHIPKFLRNWAEKTPIIIDPWSMAQSMVIVGSAGGGKSVFIQNLVDQQAFALNVFYSKKGDYEILYFRPGVGDAILNPTIEGGTCHNILEEDPEFIAIYVETLLNSTVGDKADFFSGSAKQSLRRFCEEVKVNERDNNITKTQKWELFISYYEKAVNEAKNGKQKSQMDVMSTVSSIFREALYLMAYRIIHGADTWTAKDFIYKGNCKQNLFITGSNKDMEKLSAASLTVLIQYQLTRADIETWDSNFLTGYFLDEYKSLQAIMPEEVLFEISRVGRSKRMVPIKAVQSLEKSDTVNTSELTANMMYMVVFSTTCLTTKRAILDGIGEVIYREKKYNEERGSKDRGTLRNDQRVNYSVLENYHLDILQKENYSSILFSPKQGLLTKMYTPLTNIKPKPYVIEMLNQKIDDVSFIKWRLGREKAMDQVAFKSMMKDDVMDEVKKNY